MITWKIFQFTIQPKAGLEHLCRTIILISLLIIPGFWFQVLWAQAEESNPQSLGEYIFRAAGGCTCHTDIDKKGKPLAGGRPLKTPFGVIFSSNITPDTKTGIGLWTDNDFTNSMTLGVGPQGEHLFPVFPYTSFTRVKKKDLIALKNYLFTYPPIINKNKSNELWPVFGWRFGLVLWKWLNFSPGTFQSDPAQSAQWNRGAYLVTALAHCAECHTPRNLMGGLKKNWMLAGSKDGPEGQIAPNITPDKETGIGSWSRADLVWYLQTGQKPNGDDTQGLMSEVIEEGFRYLINEDVSAIAEYILSLKPIRNKIEP